MTDEALIGIVPRPGAIGIDADLRKQRIKLTRNGRTIRDVITAVAGGLQLSGALNAFLKRLALIIVDGCACGRVRTDQRRMRDWNPLLLSSSTSVLDPAPNPRIFLGKRWDGH